MMPEADIFPLQPDYPVSRRLLSGLVESLADSGRRFARLKRAPRLMQELELRRRPTADKMQLEEWYRRFERSWFTFHDPVFAADPDSGSFIERYFSVEFTREPEYELVGNEAWDLRVSLIDRVGASLLSYPDPVAGHKSVFLEENEAAAVLGSWPAAAHPLAHGGNEQRNANDDTTDALQWSYAGYGLRLWARRAPNLGIMEVLLDAASLGTVDLYAAADQASQPLLARLDVPLGLHNLKLRATNTRNAASLAGTIAADALEIMI
jgi:hypothetical protein